MVDYFSDAGKMDIELPTKRLTRGKWSKNDRIQAPSGATRGRVRRGDGCDGGQTLYGDNLQQHVMAPPKKWVKGKGPRTDGAGAELFDEKGRFEDERDLYFLVQNGANEFAPANASEGDTQIKELVGVELDKLCGFASARSTAGNNSVDLHGKKDALAATLERLKPEDQTPLMGNAESHALPHHPPLPIKLDTLLTALLLDTHDLVTTEDKIIYADKAFNQIKYKFCQKIVAIEQKLLDGQLKGVSSSFRAAVQSVKKVTSNLHELDQMMKTIQNYRVANRHGDVRPLVQTTLDDLDLALPSEWDDGAAKPAVPAEIPADKPAAAAGEKRKGPPMLKRVTTITDDESALTYMMKKMKAKGEEVSATLADEDGDGQVTVDEFGEWLKDYCAEARLTEPGSETIYQEWATLTGDERTSLSTDEYAARINEIQEAIEDADLSSEERIKKKRAKKTSSTSASSGAAWTTRTD